MEGKRLHFGLSASLCVFGNEKVNPLALLFKFVFALLSLFVLNFPLTIVSFSR